MTEANSQFGRILRMVTRALAGTMLVAGMAHAQWTGQWTTRPLANAASGAPNARGWVDLIFDPVVGRPVLIGGSGSVYNNDVLQIDFAGQRWVEIEPRVSNVQSPYGPPCARDEHASEYDPIHQRYWIVGGSGYTCGHRTSTADAGTTTTTVVDPTLTATQVDFYKDYWVTVIGGVVYRAFVSAYDPATKTLTLDTAIPVLAPGKTYSMRSQVGGGTWSYTPSNREWYGFSAPGFGYTGPNPGDSRYSPALAYSSADQVMVMFGGAPYNDTWVLDLDAQLWQLLIPSGAPGSPPHRSQTTNSMAYDPVNDAFVLFGGNCTEAGSCDGVALNSRLNDTWIYRLATNTWTLAAPPVSPAPRNQHTLTYDPVNRVMVLFGGRDGATIYGDTWVYDLAAATWTQVATAGDPTARYLHGAVYDPVAGEHVIYGGNTVVPLGGTIKSVVTLELTGPLPPTTTNLVSSPNPSIVGAGVTMTATVNGIAPTGTVAFTDGGNPVAGCTGLPLSGAGDSRAAACITSALTQGIHAITATYGGDTGNAGSNSVPLSQVVNAQGGGNAPVLQGAWLRRVHGAAGTFDLPLSLALNAPSAEPRAGTTHSLVLAFDQAIVTASVAVTEGVATVGSPAISGNMVIVDLAGVPDQQYVTVALSNIVPVGGGASGFASIRSGFLAGDVNQSGVVTISDLGLVNAQLAAVVTSANYRTDVNTSGTLTLSDLALVNFQLTKALPQVP